VALLRHFNTGQYLKIDPNAAEEALITDQITEHSEFVFEPVNTKSENINKYNKDTVFKVRCNVEGEDDEADYLRIYNKEKSDFKGDEIANIFQEDGEGLPRKLIVDD
jgi:hypothetical protein